MTRALRFVLFVYPCLTALACRSDLAGVTDVDAGATEATAGADAGPVRGGRVAGAAGNGGAAGAAGAAPAAGSDGSAGGAGGAASLGGSAGAGAAPVDAGAPVDARGGSWAPSSLAGLVLWLDARDSDSLQLREQDELVRWFDRSPAHNDAFPEGPGAGPRLRKAKGRAEVAWEPSSTKLTVKDAQSLQLGTSDFVVAMSARYPRAPEAGMSLLAKQLGVPPFTGIVLFASDVVSEARQRGTVLAMLAQDQQLPSVRSGYDDGEPHVVVLRRAQGRLDLFVDGRLDASMASRGTNVDAAGYDLYLGAPFPYRGGITEVVLARAAVSDAELANLTSYLVR
jgi:hypothetical protein